MPARLALLAAVFVTVQTALPLIVPLLLYVAWGALTVAAITAARTRKQVR